ncbi:MAG TPA: siphovirus Gp157 family protein [Thermoleophilia bacterium]|nr:siphovirus Gp157 family protein [Thermoleophilia bacterium]
MPNVASKKTTLYAIAEQVQDVMRRIEFEDGELTPELEEMLNAVEGLFEDKVRHVGQALWRAEQKLVEETAILTLVKARHQKAKRHAESLSRYLGQQLNKAGIEVDGQVEGVPVTWSAKESTETVVPKHYYENPGSLPPRCWEMAEVYTIDRREVRKLMDDGVEMPEGIEIKRTYTARVS